MDFYAVRNKDGAYFAKKKANYYARDSRPVWISDLKKAKLFKNMKTPRTLVTYLAQTFPNEELPQIVVFTLTEVESLCEKERVEKSLAKKKTQEEQRLFNQKKRQLEEAKANLERAEKALKEAKRVSELTQAKFEP